MAGDGSAYAALGLEPGADTAAVEAAYKRMIKRYHPDREGGDAKRAAEINRAYRELRGGPARDKLEFNEWLAPITGKGNGWVVFALAIAALLLGLLVLTGWRSPASSTGPVARFPAGRAPAAMATDPMDQPLAVMAVAQAVGEAVRMSRSQDEMALATASRDCHHELRLEPSLTQLDRCAAFDDAVVQLQDRDPLRDQGPFSELTVTGRQWSGAQALSNDYLAIDGRLDRIRLQVELALVPAAPPPPEPVENSALTGN
jgi:hypothetical protein